MDTTRPQERARPARWGRAVPACGAVGRVAAGGAALDAFAVSPVHLAVIALVGGSAAGLDVLTAVAVP